MATLGYTLSSEEHGPTDLVDIAAGAEHHGFDFVSLSDHFHPWVTAQGESPFVWSTLGAIAERTDEVEVGVGVTCPTIRIHPVNVAHAVATAAVQFDGRFTFGVGTGENLNEHVTGERWPEHDVRLAMLDEAIDLMRALWTGENTSHHGEYYTVENAKLFTTPETIPDVIGSAFGPKTGRWVAKRCDGLWCSGLKQEPLKAYEEAGGDGETWTQLHMCVADSEDAAIETVLEQWPNGAIPGELGQDLPTPAHFEQAAQLVDREAIAESGTLTTDDPDSHIERIQQAIDMGFEYVYVHQIGDEQDRALSFYEEEVLPSFD